MTGCHHEASPPAAFELVVGDHSMRYHGTDGVLAAASTFGGRWRVTDPSGSPLFSLAPAGAPGTDDREVVPQGGGPVAVVMRDRRRADSWLVHSPEGALVARATLNGPYEVMLTDADGVLLGRIFACATSLVVELGTPPDSGHCLAFALPLYFATTGALRLDSLDAPAPDLALWA